MEFSRQGYWSRLPFPSPRDLPNPGIKPGSLALLADSLPLYLWEIVMKPQVLRGDALEMGPLHKARTFEDCNCFVKRENKLPTGPGRQPGSLSQL